MKGNLIIVRMIIILKITNYIRLYVITFFDFEGKSKNHTRIFITCGGYSTLATVVRDALVDLKSRIVIMYFAWKEREMKRIYQFTKQVRDERKIVYQVASKEAI